MTRTSSPTTALYVTVDGVLQQLGYSQVCRVLLGLSKLGVRYKLLSLESTADLADQARVRALRDQLGDHGIEWLHHAYDQSGTARAAGVNLLRVGRSVHALAAKGGVSLVHARAYHSALVAVAAKKALGIPYVFDARGRWIDERLLGGRWFTNPLVEAGARAFERQLYTNATGLVVLTKLHGEDIMNGDFGEYTGAPIRVITTCADFGHFDLNRRFGRARDNASLIPSELAHRLAGKLVLGFVGSTNAFYRHAESFALAQRILARRSDAHLLILSAQRHEFSALAARHAIPPDRVTVTTASHEAMPEWLSRIDWAIQLLNSGVAKRGSMPTKLAEFFAAGVRPIHFGCNEEVSDWVERAGSGLVLRSLEPDHLESAAEYVAAAAAAPQVLEQARARTQPHFDLAAGLASYASLLHELGQSSAAQAR